MRETATAYGFCTSPNSHRSCSALGHDGLRCPRRLTGAEARDCDPRDDGPLAGPANQLTPPGRVSSGIRSSRDPPALLRRPPGEPPSTALVGRGHHRSGNCSTDTSTSFSASTTTATGTVTASGGPSSQPRSRSTSPAATRARVSRGCGARGAHTSWSSPSPAAVGVRASRRRGQLPPASVASSLARRHCERPGNFSRPNRTLFAPLQEAAGPPA